MHECFKKSLLIIDDHPVYRDALSEKLSQEFAPDGIEISVASSAHEGLELIKQTTKSWVILLDILMPGLSGLAGIKVFKDLPNVDQVIAIPAIIVNADTSPSHINLFAKLNVQVLQKQLVSSQ